MTKIVIMSVGIIHLVVSVVRTKTWTTQSLKSMVTASVALESIEPQFPRTSLWSLMIVIQSA